MASLTFPATFTVPPGLNSTLQITNRVISVNYGDGYASVRPDGLNSQYAVFTGDWDNLTLADALTWYTFLNSCGQHIWFSWVCPLTLDGVSRKWKVTKAPQIQAPNVGNVYKLQVELTQVFDPV